MEKKCKHQWEVAVWEYKRMNGAVVPTHTVANTLYCKLCLAIKQLSEEHYKKSRI